MSHTPRLWKPETRPHDCWDWLTPEDVCRHALAAFYMAQESVKPPAGQRFHRPGEGAWSDRQTFADSLSQVFAMRLKTDGYHLGVEPEWADDARMLQRWKLPRNLRTSGQEHPEVSTTSGGMGARPHGSEAEADPDRATVCRHVGVLDAAAAVRLPQKPSAP